jgi:hypothetical protein
LKILPSPRRRCFAAMAGKAGLILKAQIRESERERERERERNALIFGLHWKDVKKIESEGVEEETNVTVVGQYS